MVSNLIITDKQITQEVNIQLSLKKNREEKELFSPIQPDDVLINKKTDALETERQILLESNHQQEEGDDNLPQTNKHSKKTAEKNRQLELKVPDLKLEDSQQENRVDNDDNGQGKRSFNRRKTLKAQYSYFNDYPSLIKEFLICGALCHECVIEKDDNDPKISKFQGSSPDEIAICAGLQKIGCDFIGNTFGVSLVDYFDTQMKFQIMMSFEFDSNRKRQSHVIFDGQNYKLMVKGADSSILSKLDGSLEHPFLKSTEEMLTNFSLLGYRTLVFATRYLSKEEFNILSSEYQEITNSLENRKEKLSTFAEKIESNLILLGMTAVEDSLQKNVKETVERLLQADIKVWMITGDKLETAENIGLMAGIVNHSMEIFRLNFEFEGEGGELDFKNIFRVREVFSLEIDRVNKLINRVNQDNRLRNKTFISSKKIAVVFDMRFVGNFINIKKFF